MSFVANIPHHNHFTALFQGPHGSAGARRELLGFMVQGKINRGRYTDYPAGCHSIQTKQCPPHHPPFLQAGCPSFHPTNSVKALKVTCCKHNVSIISSFLKNKYNFQKITTQFVISHVQNLTYKFTLLIKPVIFLQAEYLTVLTELLYLSSASVNCNSWSMTHLFHSFLSTILCCKHDKAESLVETSGGIHHQPQIPDRTTLFKQWNQRLLKQTVRNFTTENLQYGTEQIMCVKSIN